jgi:hypothetical protein
MLLFSNYFSNIYLTDNNNSLSHLASSHEKIVSFEIY